MPREITITVESGRIELPRRLRREFPDGSRLVVSASNGTIVLKPAVRKTPVTREEAMTQVLAATEAIARDFDRRGITAADLKRTLKKIRAERRAQGRP